MRSFYQAVMLAGVLALSWPLAAQQNPNCSNYRVVVGSPEDQLTLAVNAASDPNAKVALLEKFAQEHSDSSYLSCAEQLLTKNYVTLQQYDQALAAGQKVIAANTLDVPFVENMLQAYMGSGKAVDEAFDMIFKAAPLIQAETVVERSTSESDAQYEAAKKAAVQRAASDTTYMAYAFFHLSSGVTDASRQIKLLDQFAQAYPETAKEQAGQLNYRYAVAYTRANQPEKADEFAEKAIAADPGNVEALNLVSYDYAFRRRINQAKAEEYAKKVLTLIPAMKKPEGASDEWFKAQQDTQQGMAHLTVGYLELGKSSQSHQAAGAIKELQQAADLLAANPELQGQAYYFLGDAYEQLRPPDHRRALAALAHAVSLKSSMQGQARQLVDRIKQVAH
ncbi:MAG TPA: hypothetical protein VMW51_03455 [Terriglobia bacterium]|nr:hypothetical protein [Terriglobia bacterium]